MVEIDVRLTPADVTAVRWYLLRRRRVTGALLLVLVGWAVLALAGGAPWYYAAILLGPITAAMVWRVLIDPRRAPRSGGTRSASSRWTVSDSELSYVSFDEDGDRLGDGRVRWDAVHRLVETGQAFLLFLSPRICSPIPKRGFASADDIQRFRELAADYGLLG